MKKIILMTATIIACICASNVRAGLILQNQFNSTLLIEGSLMGQTFTAEDTNISSIGFSISKMNGGTLPLTVELFEGLGVGGPSLGSAPIEGLAEESNGFFDADFSLVTLTVGESYTAIISADSPHWGVRQFRWDVLEDDPYTGGTRFLNGFLSSNKDLTFRVIPIPEPTSLSLFFLAGISLIRKNKRNANAI